MENWDDIRYVLAALREGSLTAAARSLGVRQSTVSRRIGGLETRLGVRLFERTPEGLMPTALAQEWCAMAEAMEQQALWMLASAEGHDVSPRGVVRIAVTESIATHVLVPAVVQWRELYPELEIELLVGYDFADMMRREADIALRFVRPTQGDLVVKKLSQVPLALLGTQEVVARGWSDVPWVRFFLPNCVTVEERWMREHMVRKPVMSTNSYIALVEAVRRGVGVGLVSRGIKNVAPELVEMEVSVPMPDALEMWMVTHRSLRHVARIDVVWREMERVMSQVFDEMAYPPS